MKMMDQARGPGVTIRQGSRNVRVAAAASATHRQLNDKGMSAITVTGEL
jgi:hypothetical protein